MRAGEHRWRQGPPLCPGTLPGRREVWLRGLSAALGTPRPRQAKGEALLSQLPAMALHGGFLLSAGAVCGCRGRCSGCKLSLTSRDEVTPPGHLKQAVAKWEATW